MSGTKKTHAEMKAPYEIERENRIKSNNDFLKKLNLRTIQFPGASSSHPQKTSLPNHPEEREVAVDPDYVAENEEMDDNDDDDNDNVDDETNEQDGVHYEPVEQTQGMFQLLLSSETKYTLTSIISLFIFR